MEAVSDIHMAYSWITLLYSHCLQTHSIKPRVSCKLTKDKSNSQSTALKMHHRLQDNSKTMCLAYTGYRDKLWDIPQGIHRHWQYDHWYGICPSSSWMTPLWVGNVPVTCNCNGQANGSPSKSENPCLLLPPHLVTKWDVCLVFVCKEKPSS